MTLRRKMAKPLDRLRMFSSPTKFATILETSFDNDIDEKIEIVPMPIGIVSPIVEKIEINQKHVQQVEVPRNSALQYWIGRKTLQSLDTVSRFRNDVDTKRCLLIKKHKS
uniref:Uncharacterized protein n=1 Tax=Romanomermis culicivorax TaxID=13658 RepID=A0A915IPC5_ROMCU